MQKTKITLKLVSADATIRLTIHLDAYQHLLHLHHSSFEQLTQRCAYNIINWMRQQKVHHLRGQNLF